MLREDTTDASGDMATTIRVAAVGCEVPPSRSHNIAPSPYAKQANLPEGFWLQVSVLQLSPPARRVSFSIIHPFNSLFLGVVDGWFTPTLSMRKSSRKGHLSWLWERTLGICWIACRKRPRDVMFAQAAPTSLNVEK